MFNAKFWVSAAERALKTAAQVLASLLVVGDAMIGLLDVNWPGALSAAGTALVFSLLTSIASAPLGPDNSPSLVGEPAKQPEAIVDPAPELDDTVDKPGVHARDGQGRDGAPERPVSLFDKPDN